MTSQRLIRAVGWLSLGALALAACNPPPQPATDPHKAPASTEKADPTHVPVAIEAAPDSEVPALSSEIKKVTVYSDRARVTRQGKAEIGPEAKTYAFKQLPGWVDESSVQVSTTTGRILDVRVHRSYLAKATDKGYQQAEAKAQELGDRMAALDDELEILEAQTRQIEDIKVFSVEKLTKDISVGKIGVDSYGGVVTFVGKSLRDIKKARREVLRERRELEPAIEASQRKLEEMRGLTQLEETAVLITVQGSEKATALLGLTYMLPGATWEPMHELRVSKADPQSVEVTSFAVVTQTSGEDWHDAELSFSTQSSTETVRIPELEALTLGDAKTATSILERQSASFSRAQQAFEGQNMLWNKRLHKSGFSSSFEKVYQDNYEHLQITQSKTVQIFQSLQRRGTTAHFKAMSGAIVRADGHSVRLPIGRNVLKAQQKIVAAPEQSLNAARTLEMLNPGSQPLLPGKVALYRDGAFMGMTSLDFIAGGERFSLFVSVEDQIKLSRVLDKKHSSIVRKTRTRMTVAFIVTVENLSPTREFSLTLADRIPVSENREITISQVKVDPAAKPDSKGILHWPLTLKPNEKRTFHIGYQIEYPPTLILETPPMEMPMPSAAPPMMFEPRKRRLEEDIGDLEQMF